MKIEVTKEELNWITRALECLHDEWFCWDEEFSDGTNRIQIGEKLMELQGRLLNQE